jgi:hypothetical protein
LRAQIIEVASAANCNSQNSLLRFLRVKGGRARQQAVPLLPARRESTPGNGDTNLSGESGDPFAHLLVNLQQIEGELEKINFKTLSALQCQAMQTWLEPLMHTCIRAMHSLRVRARTL